VLIVVASAHRARPFDACRWLIDTLKKTVPIWKKEETFAGRAVWADGEPFPAELAVGGPRGRGMRAVAAMLVAGLLIAGVRVGWQRRRRRLSRLRWRPTPEQPADKQQTGTQGAQKAAPVERRAVKPSANSVEQVNGPLGRTQNGAATQQPVNPERGCGDDPGAERGW